jgi:hypothetical protein
MSDIACANAAAYARRYQLRLAERLGFGIHGNVHVVERVSNLDQSAIKAFFSPDFYHRELAVYERLQNAGITDILGFHVPQLIHADDELYVIQMTIVARPFVLDFAGAFLDRRPDFSQEIWEQWEAQKRDQFEDRWPAVQAVMDKFEELGIYLVDITPTNLAFAS